MPLTPSQFRELEWRLAFEDEALGFKVFEAKGLADVSIVHEKRGKKTDIRYRVRGRWADSPSEAVRLFNRTESETNYKKRGQTAGA